MHLHDTIHTTHIQIKKTADHLNESVRTNKTGRGTYRIAFGFSIYSVAVSPLFFAPHSIGHQTVPLRPVCLTFEKVWLIFRFVRRFLSRSYIPLTTHWQAFSNGKLLLTKPHRFGMNSILTLTYPAATRRRTNVVRQHWYVVVLHAVALHETDMYFNVLAANKRQEKLRLNGIATVDRQPESFRMLFIRAAYHFFLFLCKK